ncbi:MAG: hypothetical protein F4X44_12700 [Gammaproteobacteria bacterium]|nr:hypothetical protein [Gammaproteobacteria bacterium]MYD81455.1 hypothetical protein [Gammaproteobacteria bacterium]
MSIEKAIADRDWELLRTLILQKHAKSRQHVGLDDSSELSAFQLVAFYESEYADDLLTAGFTCDLHSACALGREDLIKSENNPEQLGLEVEHLTPMGWAIIRGQKCSVDGLLSVGDDPNRPLKRAGFFVWEIEALNHIEWSPVHMASVHGYNEAAPAMVKSLAEAGANIEKPSPLGCSALSLASIYSWIDVMETLLDLGANINSESQPESDLVWSLSAPSQASARSYGLTPLMIAVGEGQEKAVDLLLKRGCDIRLRDSLGSTALHIAANPWWKENVKIVEFLLSAGMDPTVVNGNNETSLDLARRRDYQRTTHLLESMSH